MHSKNHHDNNDKETDCPGSEEAFITYLIEQHGRNRTRAARRAGYKDGPNLRMVAYRLSKRPRVEAAMEDLQESMKAAQSEAKYRLTLQLRGKLPTRVTLSTGAVDGNAIPSETRQYDMLGAAKAILSHSCSRTEEKR